MEGRVTRVLPVENPSTSAATRNKFRRMALTYSQMLPLGTPASDFRLPDYTGQCVSLSDFKDAPVLLLMFICNHCPYVQHVRPTIAKVTNEYKKKGVASVAINSNDAREYPTDSPAMMEQEVQAAGYRVLRVRQGPQALLSRPAGREHARQQDANYRRGPAPRAGFAAGRQSRAEGASP
jgi:thiol-disulfide isomerase/thioredoxin